MSLHPLAALFEPRSLLILSSHDLPVVQAPPERLRGRIAEFRVGPDGRWQIPVQPLAFLQDGQRLDMALLCLDPVRLPVALAALRVHRPRTLVLLPHETPSMDPVATRSSCQAWGRANDCLVLGPGALGIQRPHLGLNLGLDGAVAPVGRVALVAQSRMIAAAVMDWADDVQLGFSAVVSVGDAAGVTVAEILDYLAMDARTDSIVLYLEEADSSRHFTSALLAAASIKPVIVLKASRLSAERDPVADAVFDALLRRTGAVRIRFFVQLFSALKVLAHVRHRFGRRVALFSNGYGAAHLSLDVMGQEGPLLRARLSSATRRELAALLEPGSSVDNPVISHAPLQAAPMQRVLQLLAGDPSVDGVLVLLAPDALSDMERVASVLTQFSLAAAKPIVSCLLGDAAMRPLRHRLDAVGLPVFRTPETATQALGILASYHYNQTLAQQVLPPEMLNRAPRMDEARSLLGDAVMSGRMSLDRQGCAWLLDCFHVPIRLSAGGRPDTVQGTIPMAIHVRQDARFGPYIQFGPGGACARLSSLRREIELPPLTTYLAHQLIQRGAFWSRVLERDLSAAALERLTDALERISEIVSELPGIRELTLDPLWSDDTNLLAGDMQVVLDPGYDGERPENRAYGHMAIHPYPRRLVRAMITQEQEEWLLRPIRPEDAALLQEFVRNLSDESRYMRFVSMLRELTPQMLARYTRVDYDREVALVATVQVANPDNRGLLRERIVGFAHCLRNSDGQSAEYALVIADDWQRHGVGSQLMQSLIDVARQQKLDHIEGLVLSTNYAMLALMERLGFRNDPDNADPSMRRLWLDLNAARSG